MRSKYGQLIKTKFIQTEELSKEVYLEGEYIIPVERKIKWHLKEFNSSFR